MMLPPRVFTYVRIMASLITTTQAAAVFKRQTASTNLLSTITDDQGAVHQTQSPTTTVTKMVVITSTASSNPPPQLTAPVVSTFILTEVQSGHTSFSTVTLNPELVTTASSLPEVAQEHSPGNKGAIAGSVLGALAVMVAAFAVFVRFRRRSPKHWRNRTLGRWQSFDNGAAGSAGARSVYAGEAVYRGSDIKRADPGSLPALHIRDRQPAVDQFGDASETPASPCSRKRTGSYYIGRHRRTESNALSFGMELQPTTGSPK